jgi:hypothetical protein
MLFESEGELLKRFFTLLHRLHQFQLCKEPAVSDAKEAVCRRRDALSRTLSSFSISCLYSVFAATFFATNVNQVFDKSVGERKRQFLRISPSRRITFVMATMRQERSAGV